MPIPRFSLSKSLKISLMHAIVKSPGMARAWFTVRWFYIGQK